MIALLLQVSILAVLCAIAFLLAMIWRALPPAPATAVEPSAPSAGATTPDPPPAWGPPRPVGEVPPAHFPPPTLDPRPFVRDALRDQLAYEVDHKHHQNARLAPAEDEKSGPTEKRRTVTLPDGSGSILRGHGHFDHDQRVDSVLLRATVLMRKQDVEPPQNLRSVVLEEVRSDAR